MNTRVISDLHLGHSSSKVKSVEMLAPLLEGCDHLVLAGDVWQARTKGECYDRGSGMFDEFLGIIESRGISMEVLRGNHDPETEQGVAWLAQRQVLVTHGDAIYDDATPWSREMPHHREKVKEIVERYAGKCHLAQACSDRAYEIAVTIKPRPMLRLPVPLNFFATAFWPPTRTFEMIRVWNGMGSEGLRFLKKSGEGAKMLVCGHFHRPGIWIKDGYVMVNTGAFMRGCRPWMVDVEGQRITAREVALKLDQFVPGKVRGRWLLGE